MDRGDTCSQHESQDQPKPRSLGSTHSVWSTVPWEALTSAQTVYRSA